MHQDRTTLAAHDRPRLNPADWQTLAYAMRDAITRCSELAGRARSEGFYSSAVALEQRVADYERIRAELPRLRFRVVK